MGGPCGPPEYRRGLEGLRDGGILGHAVPARVGGRDNHAAGSAGIDCSGHDRAVALRLGIGRRDDVAVALGLSERSRHDIIVALGTLERGGNDVAVALRAVVRGERVAGFRGRIGRERRVAGIRRRDDRDGEGRPNDRGAGERVLRVFISVSCNFVAGSSRRRDSEIVPRARRIIRRIEN